MDGMARNQPISPDLSCTMCTWVWRHAFLCWCKQEDHRWGAPSTDKFFSVLEQRWALNVCHKVSTPYSLWSRYDVNSYLRSSLEAQLFKSSHRLCFKLRQPSKKYLSNMFGCLVANTMSHIANKLNILTISMHIFLQSKKQYSTPLTLFLPSNVWKKVFVTAFNKYFRVFLFLNISKPITSCMFITPPPSHPKTHKQPVNQMSDWSSLITIPLLNFNIYPIMQFIECTFFHLLNSLTSVRVFTRIVSDNPWCSLWVPSSQSWTSNFTLIFSCLHIHE